MPASTSSHAMAVVERAKALLGRDAEEWLYRQNRNLAKLAPFEMAQSSVGARVVLWELERICRIEVEMGVRS
jgi:hypothetical protein